MIVASPLFSIVLSFDCSGDVRTRLLNNSPMLFV